MKLKYFGTAAAEGLPALFCNCRVCRHALENRGKNVRTRSQSLVDDKILIDFPPDTYLHVLNYGLDLRHIHHCIITHSHHDHLFPRDLWCRSENIAYDIGDEPLHVYVTEDGYRRLFECEAATPERQGRTVYHKIEAFEPFDIEDYHIIPLKARHAEKTNPVIYIIEHGDRAMLYANDTSCFPEETWDFLVKYGRAFDLVSLDCTYMALDYPSVSHMSLEINAEVEARMRQIGVCDGHTVMYVNHFSHNGGLTHDELVKEAKKYGYGVSYDGCEIEF